MKRICFIICALCVCMLASAQSKKVENFDKNSWKWIEGTDKIHSVHIEDGYLVIINQKYDKKITPYQNLAKSYARIPLRPNENFKLTIKYIVADYNLTWHSILFNVDKKCMMDEDETGMFEAYELFFQGPFWRLNMGECATANDKLPGKVKTKGEYPMEFVMEKKSKNVSIEVNGIELYEGDCKITNPCIGFAVPFFNKKASSIKIDEIILEQADRDDD